MSQDTPTAASAAATEATYTEVPPATSSPGSGAGDDCIASSATRSTLSRTNPGPGATRTPSRSDSVRDSHRRGAPERSYIAISLLSHPRVHMERPPRPTGRWSLPTNPDTRRSLAHFATSHPDRVMTTIRTGETVAARCLPARAAVREEAGWPAGATRATTTLAAADEVRARLATLPAEVPEPEEEPRSA